MRNVRPVMSIMTRSEDSVPHVPNAVTIAIHERMVETLITTRPVLSAIDMVNE